MTEATLNINLNAIYKNLNRLQNLSERAVETAVVLKADAYGLGVDPIAKYLFDKGVRTFFVATVTEALELSLLLPLEAQIYYLNGFSENDSDIINNHNITPILNSLDQINSFKNKILNKSAALQIDIGMKRLGLNPCEVIAAKKKCKSMNLKLILGHLSSADNEFDSSNHKQLSLFSKLSSNFPCTPKSLAATGGTILGKDYHFDLTRPGIGIFGGKPLKRAENVVTVNLPILQIKDIKQNDGVGYNHTFVSKEKMKIATVGAGYADGLSRQLSNSGVLYAGNTKCPILGRVSMDLITVDISNVTDTPKALSALGPLQTIDDLAKQSNTVGYEILTSLGSRYKRVYHY